MPILPTCAVFVGDFRAKLCHGPFVFVLFCKMLQMFGTFKTYNELVAFFQFLVMPF